MAFGARLRQAGYRLSMGSPGSALDNAACESFFASQERELTGRRNFDTRGEARTAIFEWIEAFYNRTRLHSTLGYLAPYEFEARQSREPRPIGDALERVVSSLRRRRTNE